MIIKILKHKFFNIILFFLIIGLIIIFFSKKIKYIENDLKNKTQHLQWISEDINYLKFNLNSLALVKDSQLGKELESKLISNLQRYEVQDLNNRDLIFFRNGRPHNGGYVVPSLAFEKSDFLLGYGIADDISFEEQFADKYKKPAFGFDCGISDIKINNPLLKFVPECIGTDKTLYSEQTSNMKIVSFQEQINNLRLDINNKKFFIKMDIEGGEYDALESMIKIASKNITGIVVEIHWINKKETAQKAVRLLELLNKHFYLIHLHNCNCAPDSNLFRVNGNLMPYVVELTFINKNLVKNAKINNKILPLDMDMSCMGGPDIKFQIPNV